MSIDLETVKSIALWASVLIAAAGVMSAIVIKKVIGKVLSLVIAAAIVFMAWQQRSKVVEFADDVHGQVCASSTTFFSIEVSMPEGWCKSG